MELNSYIDVKLIDYVISSYIGTYVVIENKTKNHLLHVGHKVSAGISGINRENV